MGGLAGGADSGLGGCGGGKKRGGGSAEGGEREEWDGTVEEKRESPFDV